MDPTFDVPEDPESARIRTEIARRYRQICADWAADQNTIERHHTAIQQCQLHQQELAAKANDCEAAARLFGFNVVAEMARVFEQEQTQVPLDVVPKPAAAPAPIPSTAPQKGPTVKDMVLDILRNAYPNPVRTSEIRQQLANRGIVTHEKTVGMSLYRWLRAGRIHRQGWDWFFANPEAAPASTVIEKASEKNDPSGALLH
jgi:hypothetical protein